MYTYAIKDGARKNRGLHSDFNDFNDFNSNDDDGETNSSDQHYRSVLHV